MIDKIVYIKHRLLSKVIKNQCFLQPFLIEEYISKMLFIPLAVVNN